MHLPLLCLLFASASCAAGIVDLQSAKLRAGIDDATGAVAALAGADGTELLSPSFDRYALQPDPKSETVATEAEDRVVSRHDDTFVCENPKLPGVRIEKAYALTDAWLSKTVTFRTERHDAGLFKYGTGSTVAADFFRGARLNDPSRHPLDDPYPPASAFEKERQISDSHAVADHYLVICTNPGLGRGLAQYRFKVNGRFVQPLSSYAYEPSLFYGPTGWRMGCAAAWLSDDRPALSCEVRWHAFSGDHVAFHREFLALPEFQKEWAAPVPPWLGRVRAVTSWTWASSPPHPTHYAKLAASLPDDALLMVMISGVFCNTRAYTDDPIPAPSGVPLPAAELRRVVDELHALSPKIRVGPITWQWGFGESDPVFKAHPEWTVHDGDGQPVFAATGWSDEKVYSQLLTPECRDFVLEQYRTMQKRFDFDFIYMDTGQSGVTRFDWTTRRNAQDYDWADLYTGIRQAARGNRDGIAFFNGTPRLYSVGADCGYFEGVGIFKERDWRALADRLFLVKLFQPGDRWTMPLYWTDKRSQEYANYCFLLALKPGDFIGGAALKRWPLIAAANELTAAQLAPEANPRPCWWRERTETECYAMLMPGGALLTALHHGPEAAKVSLSCDLAPLGLDPKKPVHVWLFTPKPLDEVEKATLVTEAEANAIFAKEGGAPHRCVEARFLGTRPPGDARFAKEIDLLPNRTVLLLLTQSTNLAHVVDGRPSQFLLPAPGRTAETIAADQKLPAALAARREGFSMAGRPLSPALAPEQSSPDKVNHTERDVNREVSGVRVRRFLTLDCEHNGEDAAGFDADALRLWADMGLEKTAGFAAAAVEADNLGAAHLRLRLRQPLYGKFAVTSPFCFAGLVADYHTAGGYSRRVLFPLAPEGNSAQASSRPWWGVFREKKKIPALVAPIEMKDETALDLGRYAPEGWDGRVIFGVHLDSCGLGARLEAQITGNGPAGPRDPGAFREIARNPPAAPAGKAGSFRGAALDRLENGAALQADRILIPANGALEAAGLRVVTWKITLASDAKGAGIWINFHRGTGEYQLVKLPLDGGPLAGKARPGAESRFDLDLRQFAPKDWDGRVRIRFVGTGASAEIVDNASFQIF